MNEDYTKQKWNAASGMGAASRIEQILRAKFDKSMEWIKKIKVLRLYFDSNLGSNLEDEAFIAISDAIYNTLKGIPNIKFFSNFRVVGMTIAHVVCKRLYLLKLIYHANSGRITKNEFCELAAKHLAVETAMLIHKLWDVTVKALPFLLLTLGATFSTALLPWITAIGVYISAHPEVVNTISEILNHFTPYVKDKITPEKVEELLKGVIGYTLKYSRIVLQNAEAFYNKFKAWGRIVCEKFGWNVPDSLNDIIIEEEDETLPPIDITDIAKDLNLSSRPEDVKTKNNKIKYK